MCFVTCWFNSLFKRCRWQTRTSPLRLRIRLLPRRYNPGPYLASSLGGTWKPRSDRQKPKTKQKMTEQFIVRRASFFALVVVLEFLAPAAVAVGMLYFLCRLYDVKWTDFFEVLAVLASLLTLLLPRPKPTMQPASSGPLAMAVIMRWMIIVAILLAIGYITQYSEDFSRRVLISWIVLTPAAL